MDSENSSLPHSESGIIVDCSLSGEDSSEASTVRNLVEFSDPVEKLIAEADALSKERIKRCFAAASAYCSEKSESTAAIDSGIGGESVNDAKCVYGESKLQILLPDVQNIFQSSSSMVCKAIQCVHEKKEKDEHNLSLKSDVGPSFDTCISIDMETVNSIESMTINPCIDSDKDEYIYSQVQIVCGKLMSSSFSILHFSGKLIRSIMYLLEELPTGTFENLINSFTTELSEFTLLKQNTEKEVKIEGDRLKELLIDVKKIEKSYFEAKTVASYCNEVLHLTTEDMMKLLDILGLSYMAADFLESVDIKHRASDLQFYVESILLNVKKKLEVLESEQLRNKKFSSQLFLLNNLFQEKECSFQDVKKQLQRNREELMHLKLKFVQDLDEANNAKSSFCEQEKMQEALLSIDALQRELISNKEEFAKSNENHEKKIKKLQQEIQNNELYLVEIKFLNQALEGKLRCTEEEKEELENNLKFEKAKLSNELEKLKNEINKLLREKKDLTQDIEKLKNCIEELKKENKEIEGAAADHYKGTSILIEGQKEELNSLRQKLYEKNDQVLNLEHELRSQELEMLKLKAEIELQNQHCKELKAELEDDLELRHFLSESYKREEKLQEMGQEKDEELKQLQETCQKELSEKNNELENLTCRIIFLEEEILGVKKGLEFSSEMSEVSSLLSSSLSQRSSQVNHLHIATGRMQEQLVAFVRENKYLQERIAELMAQQKDTRVLQSSLKAAREQASTERIAAASVTQKMALLQIELDSTKATLEQSLQHQKFLESLSRVKNANRLEKDSTQEDYLP